MRGKRGLRCSALIIVVLQIELTDFERRTSKVAPIFLVSRFLLLPFFLPLKERLFVLDTRHVIYVKLKIKNFRVREKSLYIHIFIYKGKTML